MAFAGAGSGERWQRDAVRCGNASGRDDAVEAAGEVGCGGVADLGGRALTGVGEALASDLGQGTEPDGRREREHLYAETASWMAVGRSEGFKASADCQTPKPP